MVLQIFDTSRVGPLNAIIDYRANNRTTHKAKFGPTPKNLQRWKLK